MSNNPDYAQLALQQHRKWRGKFEIKAVAPVSNKEELAIAYTPGVAEPCLAIEKDKKLSYDLTRRWNLCLVVTDGSAVLGLGNIGPEAAMPVMEGKCALFKAFGGVDAFPICINSQDVDEIVNTIYRISSSFGGINLEDIAAPRCFEIERRLKQLCDIPIFHDDQHGTAIVTFAALINALKLVDKKLSEVKIVFNGAGAAALAITRLLLSAGAKDITLCDLEGIVYLGRKKDMDPDKTEIAALTNPRELRGTLADALVDADVFIGVSAGNTVNQEMVSSMAKKAIVFACANPIPEIYPEEALAGGAAVVATGRSDFPNQINNVLAFPGVFRGAFDVRASEINDEMNIAAAHALADLVSKEELAADNIMPEAFNPKVREQVAKAVSEAAIKSGVARI